MILLIAFIVGECCESFHDFLMADSDFNGLDFEYRSNGNYKCAEVLIKDNVYISNYVRTLKGIKVRQGKIIVSRSVVMSYFELMSAYAGVPAKN